MKKPKVLVAILCHDGWVHSSVLKSVFDIMTDDRIEAEMLLAQMSPVDYTRNSVVKYALMKEKDWVISIDADNAPIKNPVDLLFLGKDLIFCPTPMHDDLCIRMNTFLETKERGLVETKKCGSGCYVVSKNALDTIPSPHFEFKKNNEGRVILSEDIYFCEKAVEAGITPYVHTEYPCHHFHEVDLWEIVNEYKHRE